MPTIETLLRKAETSIPRFEAELLLAHIIKKTQVFVIAHPEYFISEEPTNQFASYTLRRIQHEPIALIVGHKEFYGREFLVNKHTLIPRPETELLIENIQEHISNTKSDSQKISFHKHTSILILDIGTGSGNIITTLAEEIATHADDKKSFTFLATDISESALDEAKKNAEQINPRHNIQFIHSNLLEKIPKKKFLDADEILIAANLPYLSKKEFHQAPPDIQNFEPKSALESGTAGLDHYQRLLEELRQFFEEQKINPKTTLFFEISPSQETSIQQLILAIFPQSTVTLFQDLAKKYRLAKISLNVSSQAR
ncbi:MAG: peptide chain release factor N(5)-glutamine methyltransferase [Candidatus Moraniibacteriota bacterium]